MRGGKHTGSPLLHIGCTQGFGEIRHADEFFMWLKFLQRLKVIALQFIAEIAQGARPVLAARAGLLRPCPVALCLAWFCFMTQ
jgi:hypothetical protein